MSFPSSVREKAYRVLDRYGVLLAGILIFAYYLWSALDMFTSPDRPRSLQGYFFRFDSVIMLWLLLYMGVKLYDHKKKQKINEENSRKIILEHEWQKRQFEMLDEVTTVVSDAINNPLAVISVSAGSIRERFKSDSEILDFLDRIDGALKRMHEVLNGFQNYQTKKILKSAAHLSSPSAEEGVSNNSQLHSSRRQSSPSVSPTGEIHNA